MRHNFKFEEIENDPQYSFITKLLREKYEGKIPEEIKLGLMDNFIKSKTVVSNRSVWIGVALRISKRIINGEAVDEEYPLFWIKVYGIVKEYSKFIRKLEEYRMVIDFLKPQVDAFNELVKKIEREDLILIEFMRNHHVHMEVDDIYYQMHGKGDDKPLKISPPKNPDAIEVVKNIFERNGNDQKKIAFEIAKKIPNELEVLYTAVKEAEEA